MAQRLIPTEQVERLRAALAEAPRKPKTGYMVREIVQELASALLEMRQKGYDLTDIAAYFAKQDITVSASTIGTYLRDYQRDTLAQKEKPQMLRRKAGRPAVKPHAEKPEDHSVYGNPAREARSSPDAPAIVPAQEG